MASSEPCEADDGVQVRDVDVIAVVGEQPFPSADELAQVLPRRIHRLAPQHIVLHVFAQIVVQLANERLGALPADVGGNCCEICSKAVIVLHVPCEARYSDSPFEPGPFPGTGRSR